MTKYILVSLMLLAAPCLAADYTLGDLSDSAAFVNNQADSSMILISVTTAVGESGTLDSIMVYGGGYYNVHEGCGVIYNADSSLLDTTVHFSMPSTGTDHSMYTANFVGGESISAETEYLIGFMADSATGADPSGGPYTYAYTAEGVDSLCFMTGIASPPSTFAATSYLANRNLAVAVYYSSAVSGITRKLDAVKLGKSKL